MSESALKNLSVRIYKKAGLSGPGARRLLIAQYGAPADRLEDLERRVAALEVKVI